MYRLALIKWAGAGLAGLSSLAFLGTGTLPDTSSPPGFATVVVNGAPLYVGIHEVTRREWKACSDAGACEELTDIIPFGTPDMPMTGINHIDVQDYIEWASARDATHYRLPTAEEWNSFATALPRKQYAKLFSDPRLAWAADYGSMAKVSRS